MKYILFMFAFWGISFPFINSFKNLSTEKISGVTFVAPDEKINKEQMAALKHISAKWVCINPFAFSVPGKPEVFYNTKKQWWGETPEGIRTSIIIAKQLGLKVMLKPQVWVHKHGWAGEFDLANDSLWEQWENNYAKYILTMTAIADSLNVELFCIGTEYKIAQTKRSAFWKKLISDVRKKYKGKITYAANWDSYQNISLWKELDYIGIDAYFPLSKKNTPSVEELKLAWALKLPEIKAIHDKFNKPVLFTEYGYRSIDKAAWKQWEIPDMENYSGEGNIEVQVNAYKALYETFWKQDWFAGGFIWKWYPPMADKQPGGLKNTDYTPQNKPVEQIIKTVYSNE